MAKRCENMIQVAINNFEEKCTKILFLKKDNKITFMTVTYQLFMDKKLNMRNNLMILSVKRTIWQRVLERRVTFIEILRQKHTIST